MKKTKIYLSLIITLAALLFIPSTLQVHAATGTVCLVTPGTTGCPTNPASLTGAVGTQLRVAVFLQGSDNINGFDITTLADHTILRPAGIDLTGTILPLPTTIVNECLGGVLVTGSFCPPTDTIDTIHLAATGAFGVLSSATTGLLFTAIYNITSATSGIPLTFQTGCTSTSVPNTCVTIANGTPPGVSETVQTATFSTSSPSPDFSIAASTTGFSISKGSQGAATLTLTSLNGFAGTVSITTSLTPTLRRGPTVTLSASSVALSAGGTGSTILTVSTSKNTPTGIYTITVTGTSGSITKSVTITVTVTR